MKTAEEHLYDTFNDGTGEPQTLEDFVSKLKAHPYHAPLIKAMQLYSDQQNKELREELRRLKEAVKEFMEKENSGYVTERLESARAKIRAFDIVNQIEKEK